MISLIVLLVILLPLGVIWWYQNLSHVGRHLRKLPGPGYPIFGVFLGYFGSRLQIFKNDRDNCLKYAPIYKVWIFYKSSVCLVNPDDIEIVLSSTKHIAKSELYNLLHCWLGTGLLTSDGEKWRIRRKLLTPGFHFTILKGFVDIFNEAIEKLVVDLEKDTEVVDVVPPITEFTLQSIAESSMGIYLDTKSERNKNYKDAFSDFTELSVARLKKPWLFDDNVFRLTWDGLQMKKIVNILHNFTTDIIQERQKSLKGTSYSTRKRLAMLDLLLKVQDEEGTIDNEGIREEVDTFMFEGHDTTSVAICYMLMLLANHKDIQNEVYQEIVDVMGDSNQPSYNDLQELRYTERAVKECLRLYPSVPLIGRNIYEDLPLPSGHTIPKGSMVHIFIYDLHRRPELYPDPEKFDPDRFLPENVQKRHPFAYIPFSAGSRNCIGQKFAMLEMKAVLCGILRKFVLEAVDTPEDVEITADLVLRSNKPIRVKFIKRVK